MTSSNSKCLSLLEPSSTTIRRNSLRVKGFLKIGIFENSLAGIFNYISANSETYDCPLGRTGRFLQTKADLTLDIGGGRMGGVILSYITKTQAQGKDLRVFEIGSSLR